MRATRTGIGTALRQAREARGISLQKASRETRIHSDYLSALELEHYDALRADVYVRGFLRSYSSYLGLDADKVVTFYERRATRPRPAPQVSVAALPDVSKRDLGAPKRGTSWKVAVGLAIVLLGVFGAIGLITASGNAPSAATRLPAAQSAAPAPTQLVTVRLSPLHIAHARIIADGQREFVGVLPLGKTQTYTAHSLIRVELEPAGNVDVVVNGHSLGRIDTKGPYRASFGPEDFRGVGDRSSSPGGTGSGS